MKRFLGAIASLVLIIALAVAWSGAAVGLNDDSSWQAALTSRMPSAAQGRKAHTAFRLRGSPNRRQLAGRRRAVDVRDTENKPRRLLDAKREGASTIN